MTAENPRSASASADSVAPVAVSPERRPKRAVMRLALSPDEAAEALGVGRSFFYRHVKPELRIVYRGRRRLIPVAELEAWLERESARWT